jgi:hypothetical protein
VEAGVERPDPDPLLLGGGEAPAVAGGHVVAVDPDLEVVAGALRVDLEPARERRVGGLVAAVGGEDPPPAERVDDQRGGEVAAVGVDGLPAPPADLGGLELGVGLGPE